MTLDDLLEPQVEICDTDGDAVRINPSDEADGISRITLQKKAKALALVGLEHTRQYSRHQTSRIGTFPHPQGWHPPTDSILDTVKIYENPKRLISRSGLYTYATREIALTMPLLNTEEKYFSTLCHEWAHAVCHLGYPDGSSIGHGPRWKAVMVVMGRPPNRCTSHSLADVYPNKFVDVVCPHCKKSMGALNRKKLDALLSEPTMLSKKLICRGCRGPFTLQQALPTVDGTAIEDRAASMQAAWRDEMAKPPPMPTSELKHELLEWNNGADGIYRFAHRGGRENLKAAIKDLKAFLRSPFGKGKSQQTDVKKLIKKLENL